MGFTSLSRMTQTWSPHYSLWPRRKEEEEKLGLWPSPGSLQMLNVNFDLDKRQSFPLELQETNPKVMP